MRAEIRRVCKASRLTAIYVTHDQKEALSIADRIAILDRGCVQQTGTPREVYRRPATRFVADFIGETNFIEGSVVTAANGQARVFTRIGEFTGILPRSGVSLQTGERVMLAIRPEGWQLRREAAVENGVRGHIESTTYLGEVAQYQFRAGGELLKVFEINPRFVETGRDAELVATVAPEDVIVLKD
jgi:iron(III) transport system ATP-binding protein